MEGCISGSTVGLDSEVPSVAGSDSPVGLGCARARCGMMRPVHRRLRQHS